MQTKNILFTLLLCSVSHIFATTPLFIADKIMVKQAEKIIARHKQQDPTVQYAVVNGVEEYSCTDETGAYRVQVNPQKKTVTIGLGCASKNLPWQLFVGKDSAAIIKEGGTATIEQRVWDKTVTKMWRTKKGEEKLWSSLTLPAAIYNLTTGNMPKSFFERSAKVIHQAEIELFEPKSCQPRSFMFDRRGVIFYSAANGAGKPCAREKLLRTHIARMQLPTRKQCYEALKSESKSESSERQVFSQKI